MKFQNLVVIFGLLFYWSGSIAAVSSPKTTVYPSILFPGKMWVAPTTESSASTDNIWHTQETQELRYRPLDENTANTNTAPVTRRAEYCIPSDVEQPPQQYRSEREEMPRYRSELPDTEFKERPRRPPFPEDLPPPRYRYDFDVPYYRDLSNVPPLWDWMDDPSFSDLYPPINPYDWGSPYLRNNFSATEKDSEALPLQVPLKNSQPPNSPQLTISEDWIPAPNSALVDSDEFKPNYVTRPQTMTLGEIKP